MVAHKIVFNLQFSLQPDIILSEWFYAFCTGFWKKVEILLFFVKKMLRKEKGWLAMSDFVSSLAKGLVSIFCFKPTLTFGRQEKLSIFR